MNAREYNSVLTKIKTDFKKYGNDGIIVSKINESIVEFSNVKWKRKIECSLEGFIQMIKVGYFIIDKNNYVNKNKLFFTSYKILSPKNAYKNTTTAYQ